MRDFKRQPNESEEHFIWRVYKYRDDTGELSNKQCGEICNRELNLEYNESRHRKIYESFLRIWDNVKDEYVKDEKISNRLNIVDKREEELYKAKVKTRDKLREYRKHLRDDARIEELKDIIVESAQIMSESSPLIVDKKYIKEKDKVMVVALNDWHYIEKTNNFLNQFNIDIFKDRIDKLYSEIYNKCKKEDVKNIKILNVGDLISGFCKAGIRVANEEDVISQTMRVAETLGVLITKLAKEFDSVELYSVLDNHSRTHSNIKESIEKESFGRFIPWYLESRLKNVKNVRVLKNIINEVEEYNIGICPVFDEEIFFVHGHLDKPKSVVSDLTLMVRKFPLSVFYGHLHHNFESEVHGIDLIGLPSLIGTADYSMSIRKTSLPRQKMVLYIKDENGKVNRDATYFINL